MKPFPLLLPALLTASVISCGTALTREELLSTAASYAARASFCLQNTTAFQLRGRARIVEGGLLAEGPFVFWGDRTDGLIRADFYGPDGKPAVSLRIDTSGALVYLPGEEEAFFSRGGLPVGGATLGVADLLCLVRTGFPLVMEQWQIAEGAETVNSGVSWTFTAPAAGQLVAEMRPGDLFPAGIRWEGGAISVTSSSWHDEFQAWPAGWSIGSGESATVVSVTAITDPAEPWDALWQLRVPVPVDTLDCLQPWQPDWEIPLR